MYNNIWVNFRETVPLNINKEKGYAKFSPLDRLYVFLKEYYTSP